ncbi:MAG: DUF305 domain-containing protein [Actinomycetota bacterium]|nr:DUF305 domain-containing protein [Actinomycetota bacterium]
MMNDVAEARPERNKRRVWVFSAAALVVLLVGAAIGMLITLSVVGRNDTPGAESLDVGFAQDMRVHHLQAITMAGMARDRSENELVRGLAFDIESTQLDQSGQLQGWLIGWGQDVLPPPGQPHMRWMPNGSHNHDSSSAGVTRMPGMATTDDLTRLRKVTGQEFDVFFLQLMLRHHNGGLEMAKFAAENAREGYVRNLAKKIERGQSSESTLLTNMLTERGAKPLPD